MIIKLEKIINFSSEDPDYPASNLLEKNSSSTPWKCEKPGEMMSHVTFKLSEPSIITGIDIGNYRCCIVIINASTSDDPENWLQLVNYQFMTHDEAANNKWKDQVQLFTKKEINSLTLSKKFDRVKVTCMQSANRREKFGLTFITFKTEVVVDLNVDLFGKFKMKKNNEDDNNQRSDSLREKYLRLFPKQRINYRDELKEKVKENALDNFNKRQDENREPKKRPLLEKLEAGLSDEVFGKKTDLKDENKIDKNFNKAPVKRTPFGDVIIDSDSSDDDKKIKNKNGLNQGASTSKDKSADDDSVNDKNKKTVTKDLNKDSASNVNKIVDTDTDDDDDDDRSGKKDKKEWTRLKNKVSDDEQSDSKNKCSVCADKLSMKVCKNCHKLPRGDSSQSPPAKKAKVSKKLRKPFDKLMENVTFALSGYINPQRDNIRRKALKMGAKYIANPNTTDQKCSHLISAFKNTPKIEQLKGHTKIVSHIFIEESFDHKKR